MPTADSASGPHVHFAALLGEGGGRRPTCPVTVTQRDVEALLDSRSSRTLIQEAVLEASSPAQGDPVPVVCVHGDTHEYPTTVVKLTTTKGMFEVEVGVIRNLPVPVLIGRDCPAFPMLWREALKILGREPRKRKANDCETNNTWVNVATHGSFPPVSVQALAGAPSGSESDGFEPQPGPSDEDVEGPLERSPLKGQYGTAQMQDPTLGNAR